MTAEEALTALKTGAPIHVHGDEMRRFIAVVAPTVPKEDRAEVVRMSASRVRSTAKAYRR